MFNEDRFSSSQRLFLKTGALNIYKLNMYQVLLFMHKLKFKLTPKLFSDQFFQIKHKYETRFSSNNYRVPKTKLKRCSYSIKYRGPSLWSNFLNDKQKTSVSLESFKKSIKIKLLSTDNSDCLKYF